MKASNTLNSWKTTLRDTNRWHTYDQVCRFYFNRDMYIFFWNYMKIINIIMKKDYSTQNMLISQTLCILTYWLSLRKCPFCLQHRLVSNHYTCCIYNTISEMTMPLHEIIKLTVTVEFIRHMPCNTVGYFCGSVFRWASYMHLNDVGDTIFYCIFWRAHRSCVINRKWGTR